MLDQKLSCRNAPGFCRCNKVPIFNDIKSLCNEINFLSKNLDAFGERLKIQNKNLADYLVDFDSALRVSKLITNLL